MRVRDRIWLILISYCSGIKAKREGVGVEGREGKGREGKRGDGVTG